MQCMILVNDVSCFRFRPSTIPLKNGGSDSSAHTTPTSADTPSDSTEQSVSPTTADQTSSSSSSIIFKDSSGNKGASDTTVRIDQLHEAPDAAATATNDLIGHQCVSKEVERPLCLFIQTELCEKNTLREWLLNNVENRQRRMVIKFFEQVCTLCKNFESASMLQENV